MTKHIKRTKNIYSLLIILVLVIIILIASFLFLNLFLQNKAKNPNKISKTNPSMNLPTYEDYIFETEIFDSGITIDLPEGWKAKIQNGHLTSKDLIAIRLFTPEIIKKYENYYNQPDGLLVPIYVLPPEPSFEEWFSKNYEGKNDLFIIQERKIGNKTSHLLTPDRSKLGEGPDDLGIREVVFTDKYTYVFGYHVYEISEKVVNEIFPRFKFE